LSEAERVTDYVRIEWRDGGSIRKKAVNHTGRCPVSGTSSIYDGFHLECSEMGPLVVFGEPESEAFGP
jgi:hypothetical protein